MRFKILKQNCERRDIELTYAPVLLSRHRSNISFFYTKDKTLFWMIEFFYVTKSINKENGKTQFKFFKKIVGPKIETCTLQEYLDEFRWDKLEILTDMGAGYSKEKNNELVFLIQNTYDTAKLATDFEIEQNVKDQALEKTSFVELEPEFRIEKVIKTMSVHEYPTIFITRKENISEFKVLGLSQVATNQEEIV